MKNKKKNTHQRPSDIRKQILEQLKRERDPMARELLQQRLHHYNTLVNKK